MADNIAITAGSGTTVGADEVTDGTLGSVKVAYGKIMDGTLDSTNKLVVNASGEAKVTPTANSTVDVNKVAGTTTDTNSGNKSAGSQRVVLATDDVNASAINTSTASTATNTTNIPNVVGTAASAVPSKLLQVGGSDGTNARAIKTNTSGQLDVRPLTSSDQVTVANASIPVTDNGGSLTVDGTVTASNTAGDVAHDGIDSGNPVKVGGKAVSAEPTAVSAADRANFITDLVGKQITLPYANPENNVSGAITSAMTGTTSTSLVAAPAAGLRNYITQITVSCAHATQGTDIIIQDGSGGTTLYTIPAAALYGGATLTFPVALRQPTTATAIYCANVTTGSSTKVSASGFKGA